jgi:hypothetical protein
VCLLRIGSVALLETELNGTLKVAYLLTNSTPHAFVEQGLKKTGCRHRLGLGFTFTRLGYGCSVGLRGGICSSPSLSRDAVKKIQDFTEDNPCVVRLGGRWLGLGLGFAFTLLIYGWGFGLRQGTRLSISDQTTGYNTFRMHKRTS